MVIQTMFIKARLPGFFFEMSSALCDIRGEKGTGNCKFTSSVIGPIKIGFVDLSYASVRETKMIKDNEGKITTKTNNAYF